MKIAAVLLIVTISVSFFWKDGWQMLNQPDDHKQEQILKDNNKKGKKKAGKQEKQAYISTQIKVTNTWEMPAVLREISGIAYVDAHRFACIQDELGTIFIYNTKTNKIAQEIPFGEAGDYEAITLAGKTAYVVRSDGRLYEVDNITASSPQVQQYENFLTAAQDVEGLCYDARYNRLLLAIKGVDPNSQDYKGIYAFDLASKKLQTEPVFKIALNEPSLQYTKKSKGKSVVQPSDIGVHPITADIYLTEAVHHQILVMDTTGNLKTVYQLGSSLFAKPEGITFGNSGELFISNEGKRGNGNILQVQIAKEINQ